jgi:hypothetical protein
MQFVADKTFNPWISIECPSFCDILQEFWRDLKYLVEFWCLYSPCDLTMSSAGIAYWLVRGTLCEATRVRSWSSSQNLCFVARFLSESTKLALVGQVNSCIHRFRGVLAKAPACKVRGLRFDSHRVVKNSFLSLDFNQSSHNSHL